MERVQRKGDHNTRDGHECDDYSQVVIMVIGELMIKIVAPLCLCDGQSPSTGSFIEGNQPIAVPYPYYANQL